jgi:hypothetical protein
MSAITSKGTKAAMETFLFTLAFLAVYVVLMRFVLPRFGVST